MTKILISKVFDLRVWHFPSRILFWSGNKCKVSMLENFCKIKQPQWDIYKRLWVIWENLWGSKGILLSFKKNIQTTPSDRIEKKGSLLLTIYLPDYGTQWNFLTPCNYKENALKCLPHILFLTIIFSRTSKSLSMGVFVDGS